MNRALAVLAAVISLFVAAPAADAWVRGAVPNPTVEGPIQGGVKGVMRNRSLFDLQHFGYSEREYFFGGTATSFERGVSAPYKSRLFVRLPQDPSKFNGIVVVEWLNVTGGTDLETVWPPAGEYMMRQGYGYVGVSAQLVGVCCGPASLKLWDPQRYSSLVHPGDDFSYDIFSQAIEALRDPSHNRTTILAPKPVDPMSGMKAKYVVANGASQSASRLTSFVNGGYNRGGIDVYQITRGGGPYNDFSTPIFQLNEENNEAPQPDNPHYFVWEEAGAAHAPAAWWNYVWAMQQRDDVGSTTPDAVNVACSVNHGAVDYSSRAGMYWTRRYLEQGVLPPFAPRVERDASGNIVRDANGLALGGIRHVFVQVPVALNRSDSTDCPLWGQYRSWSAEKIKSLYPTHDDYVDAVKAWANHEDQIGWLLREDRDDVIAKAEAFDGPWVDGTCYDTYNEAANETGPFSGPIGQTSFDPSLPLGTQSALRDANCNVVVPLGL